MHQIVKCLKLLFKEAFRIIQPILIVNLIRYFNGQLDLKWAIIYGTAICLMIIATNLIHHPYIFAIVRQGMQMRLAVCGLVYRKVISYNILLE